MATREILGGRVQILSLAVTEQPTTRAEPRARIVTPKGELAVLADGSDSFRHLSYVELRDGRVRGHHYHKVRHEQFYLIRGEVELHLEELATGERAVASLRAGDLACLPPGVAHALVPIGPGHGIEFAPEIFDLADVYPYTVASVTPETNRV